MIFAPEPNIKSQAEKFQHSLDELNKKMVPLTKETKEFMNQLHQHYGEIEKKAPGIFSDINDGLDSANNLMNTANKYASYKIDIPAAARNVGNIDLTNSLRDFGVRQDKLDAYLAQQKADNQQMDFILSITPGIGTAKEVSQLALGKNINTGEKYKASDYAWGTLAVASGGTTRVVGKVFGTVGELEKKAKNLEKATQGTSGIGWSMPRGGGVINGRKYSEHALERMAPDTVEIRAELNTRAREMAAKKGYKPGTAEYEALFAKIDPRGMTPNVVEDIIKNGSRSPGGKPGTWKYSREDGYVIINDKGDVVTVVPAKKK
ncbi:pre-toxin TG domain-containing protein [Bacillus pseudomycoides]|uniref:pre-toxin TG domain-containing protein n=1 Tax=Bacillus pseudomycoides TaxID=64104 RepID=UPI000A5C1F34|nr:pre-toxin TG domain-containing protein [Bacillus pseudomycoides]